MIIAYFSLFTLYSCSYFKLQGNWKSVGSSIQQGNPGGKNSSVA